MYQVTFKKDGFVKNVFFTDLDDVNMFLKRNFDILVDGFVKIKFVEV